MSTCGGCCDKACNGFATDKFICRFAATHFGQKNAGAPLNTYMRCILRFLAQLGHGSRKHVSQQGPILSALWVDDTIMVSKSTPHISCLGIVGKCKHCLAHLKTAKASQLYWHTLADDLGLTLNSHKHQDPSQRVTFTGLIIDTIQMLFLIPLPKLLKLLASLIFVRSKSHCTIRELASVRGRSRHYTVCIRHILPFIPIFSAVLGTDQKMDYDGIIDIPPIMTQTADYSHYINMFQARYIMLLFLIILDNLILYLLLLMLLYMVGVLLFDGGVILKALSLLGIYLHLKICNIKYEEKQRLLLLLLMPPAAYLIYDLQRASSATMLEVLYHLFGKEITNRLIYKLVLCYFPN